MSKKLLTETQVRRFMKLATIQPLADTFVSRSGSVLREQEEDEMLDPVQDDAVPPAGPEDAADMMAPEDLDSASGPADFDVEELVVAIADAIEGVTGVEVDVEGEGGEEEGDMDGMDDMGDMGDMGGMDDPALEMGDEEGVAKRGGMYESRMRNYIRSQIRSLLAEGDKSPEDLTTQDDSDDEKLEEAGKHTAGGEDMLSKGSNDEFGSVEKEPHRSSAGKHHTGGGDAEKSKKHMGGNSAALPLEEQITDELLERVTRQVAAKLVAASRRKK